MGSRGTGMSASDIRGEYREMLEDQVPDLQATERVIAAYQHLDADEEHLLWLALAAAQSSVGRLEEVVKARALDVIDTGRSAPSRPRQASDAAHRPPTPRKAVRRPWRHGTDLLPGDVLSFTASNGVMALFRGARVDDHRVGAAPIVQELDWSGRALPPGWRLRRLKVRLEAGTRGRPCTYRVAKHRKKDADWLESGFVVAAKLGPRSGDEAVQARTYTAWRGLARELERKLGS